MLLLGVICGLAQTRGILALPPDAFNYWAAGTSHGLYPRAWADWAGGQFLYYPPPTAQLMTILQPLGWNLFLVVWTSVIFASFWYCAGRWSLPLLALGIPGTLGVPLVGIFAGYALNGNMQWPLAALTVIAIRRPAAWSILAVTKVTPAVGVLWHIIRGEWRSASIAVLATAAILAISVALGPSLWVDFLGFTARNYTMANPPLPVFPVPFGVRLVTAGAFVIWGARFDRAWTVPVAAGWAIPALYGLGFLPFWIAALRLTSRGRSER